MFGNRKRRRKEKRKMHFSFFCLICNKKGNQKKIYVFSLLCPYKCEKCIKVMGKYVNLCYLCGLIFFWNHCIPSNLPKLGGLQICELKGNGFCLFFSSMVTKLRKRLHFLSFLFSSFLLHL